MRLAADVPARPAPLGQSHLPLPLGKAGTVGIAARVMAMGAGDALAIVRRAAIVGRQRTPANTTEHGLAFGEPMRHRDTLVEHEALALPKALLGGHRFQIFQNAALEMIDLRQPERADISRRFLTA